MLLVLTFEDVVLARLQVGSDDPLGGLGESGHLLAALLGQGAAAGADGAEVKDSLPVG